jgi:hypothetical protein
VLYFVIAGVKNEFVPAIFFVFGDNNTKKRFPTKIVGYK